jgi:hypothetical protein
MAAMVTLSEAWKAAQRHAGGPDRLAERIGIARRTLFKWKSEGVPADWVERVSTATSIDAGLLRPDLAAVFTADTPGADAIRAHLAPPPASKAA